MQIIEMYRYLRPDGGVTVSTTKPDTDYELRYRLVADEGMALVKDGVITPCVDVVTPDGWTEIEEEQPDGVGGEA